MMVQLPRYSLSTALDWSYGGVNSSIPGNGGPDCASFVSLERRLLETLLASMVSLIYTWWGWRCITLPATLPFVRKDRGGKRLLLVVVSLVFGIEIGFKLATKQLIYLLNPCHIITALQIYLLATPPNRFVTVLFRVHLNFLNGAVLAMLFPVTNSRLLPCEVEIYWLQHSLMLVTPYYLLRLGGVYTIEDLRDMSWTVMSTGLAFLYHFLPLQGIAVLSQVNLNNMLCPAISDPFYGPHYRLAAIVHQSFVVPFISKAFCAVATFFLTVCPFTKVKDHLGTDVTMSTYNNNHKNGCHDDGNHHHCNCCHDNDNAHHCNGCHDNGNDDHRNDHHCNGCHDNGNDHHCNGCHDNGNDHHCNGCHDNGNDHHCNGCHDNGNDDHGNGCHDNGNDDHKNDCHDEGNDHHCNGCHDDGNDDHKNDCHDEGNDHHGNGCHDNGNDDHRNGCHDDGSDDHHNNGDCVADSDDHRQSPSDVNKNCVRLRPNASLFSTNNGIDEHLQPVLAGEEEGVLPCSTKADNNDNLTATGNGDAGAHKISRMLIEGNGCAVGGGKAAIEEAMASSCIVENHNSRDD